MTYYEDATVQLHHGDCLDVLRTLPDASVDAVVTDPPAGIAFMAREWDDFRRARNLADAGREDVFGRTSRTGPEYGRGARGNFVAWLTEVMREALRVTKPGGHAFVWAIPRTSHWTALAIEDAGWEIRDRVAHHFGSGFPKSHNLTGEWAGWGTALKPATEDWWLARKPLAGTVAQNVLTHGTGALNIDACRVGTDAITSSGWTGMDARRHAHGTRPVDYGGGTREPTQHTGRWPANVVLDEAAAAELDQQSGDVGGGTGRGTRGGGAGGDWNPTDRTENAGQTVRGDGREVGFGDTGGASRFFYIADADEPCAEFHPISECVARGCTEQHKPDPPCFMYTAKADASERVRVDGTAHPTVKPLALMRWLVRLVTPPGGVVLEPFAGSGTTVEACILEGFRCIAIEREADYLPLIMQRIHRRRDPVQAVRGAGEDGGLFDLLDGGAA